MNAFRAIEMDAAKFGGIKKLELNEDGTFGYLTVCGPSGREARLEFSAEGLDLMIELLSSMRALMQTKDGGAAAT